MSFFIIFLGLFFIFFLVLYGLGVIRTLPKSLKILEKREKQDIKNNASIKSAKIQMSVTTSKVRYRDEDEDATFWERLDDSLFAAGISMGLGTFVVLNLPLVGIIAFVLFQFLNVPLVLSFIAAVPIWLLGVKIYLARKQKKRRDRFQKDFIDVVATISRSISVGASLQESFRIVSEEFIGPVQDEFVRMRQDILFGLNPQQAITRAADRINLQDFDFFALSVITQTDSGGNLGKSMESLRDMILNRYNLVRDLGVKTSSARFQMRFFIVLPFVMGIGMYFLSPENVMYFFDDPEGQTHGKMLVGWMCLGVLITHRMTKKALEA